MGKSHFDEDGTQNYLVFQSTFEYFTLNSSWMTKWKSEGSSNKRLEVVSTSSNTLNPLINYYGDKVRLRYTGSILKQKTVIHSHKKVVNLYVVYEITNFHGTNNYSTLTNALFVALS